MLNKISKSLKNSNKKRNYFSVFNYQYDKTQVGFFQICIAGMLDGLTTVIALSVFSLSELNMLINFLYPENMILIPFVLIQFAFLRYLVVVKLFEKSKNLKLAVFFTLYFLPIWNLGNIAYWNAL